MGRGTRTRRPRPTPTGSACSRPSPTNAYRRSPALAVDLYAFREFALGPATPRVYVQVYNLLDARNANGVYGDTGLADVTFIGPNLAVNDPGYYVRPDFYAEPRRVQLGLQVGF